MTIAILKQEPDQAVPRPFARAVNAAEMIEMLGAWWDRHGHGGAPPLRYKNVDSEEPVLAFNGVRFWAFTEGADR